MKKWVEIWTGMACAVMVFLVGAVGFAPTGGTASARPPVAPHPSPLTAADAPTQTAPTLPSEPLPSQSPATLQVVFGDRVETLSLEDYVYGVVAAEMPAAFPEAALEAQAVAARTYALYQRAAGKHADVGGDVCGESTCCQAFATQAELDARWGGDAAFYTQKLRGAVGKTAGEVLTYQGALAAAVYHASSSGQTNSAAAVWGGSQPYLVSVSTGEDTGVKGHGVGMSQRGAQAMAQLGADYREILAHYYPGTELTTLEISTGV